MPERVFALFYSVVTAKDTHHPPSPGLHLIAFAMVVVVEGRGDFVIKGPLGVAQLSLLNLMLL